MRSLRFSTVILSLVLALLALASAILLTPVYHGAEKALQHEVRMAYERDQRTLNSLMEANFKNILQHSQELTKVYEIHWGLRAKDLQSISHVIKKSLSGINGQQIDAIVIEDSDGNREAVTNFSLLNLQLPLEEISKHYSPASVWTSENTQLNSRHFSLLRLSLPVIDERFGEVIGKLHIFVLLNDNYWIINQLQGLFGSQAISISGGDSLLDGMESQSGQLQALRAAVTFNSGVYTTENNILREHYLRIGNSDDYRVRSLLPNSAQLAMQTAYTTNLYYAITLVVMLVIAAMLVIRYLITSSLSQVTHYAEQIPQSGSPKSFKGGRFHEFIRVGNAIEKMLLRIREHDKRLSSIVDNSPDLIFIKDLEQRYQLVNKRMAELANQPPEQMIGGMDKDFWSDEQVAVVRQWDQQVLQNLLPVQYEVKIDTENGLGTFLVSKFPIIDDHDIPYAIGGIATDITREKESEDLVWRQANFDSLTELPNRRMFIDRLEQHVKKPLHSNLISAVLFLNLDHFKEVNDSLGYESGDRLIKESAGRLQSFGLDFDTVARIGGDEFAIILSDLDDVNSVEEIAQNLLALLAKPFLLAGENVYITSSIGIAFYPSDATSADTLIQCAGQAMTQAKELGRNRRNYFTPSIQASVQSKIFMVNELRTALGDNQLSVFYQPIVNLNDDSVHKAEALIRWRHPSRGFISPAEFIPVAEETGLIIELGNWIFRQAARQVRSWRNAVDAGFQISVNKSPVQFRHEDNCLYEWFDFLHQQDLPGNAVVIEMTEGLLMDSGATVSSKLFALSDAGIEVALDDFGTGYSSLSYLTKYDIDYLKIDQSFVKNLEHDKEGAALCESIIVMAHRLGIRVIAEGVETHRQCEMLKAWGCDYAQGYLFSKPLPADEFETWLSNRTCELTESL